MRAAMIGLLLAAAIPMAGLAQERPSSAEATDPLAMGWMQGLPVPPEKQVRWNDGSMWQFPQWRWSFSNFRQLLPSITIGRAGPVAALPKALRTDLDDVMLTTLDGQAMRWRAALDATYTDGIVVMKDGKIVYERWFGVTGPETRHALFSTTKSFVGTLAEILIEEGRLDPDAKAGDYVPELIGSGFGDATVRQIMDMRTGLAFSEDYSFSATAGEDGKPALRDMQKMIASAGWLPVPAGYQGPKSLTAHLASIGKAAPHGGDFVYYTPNTQALQWIIERVAGISLADQIHSRFWSQMGMAHDASIGVDPIGTAFGGGGMLATLHDLARFGEMMRLGGRWQGRQIVPAGAVERIFKGGDPEAFLKAQYTGNLDGNYSSQWWHRAGGQLMALGVHGQGVYIDREAGVVIARFGSHPVASNRGNMAVTMPAYDAVVAALAR